MFAYGAQILPRKTDKLSAQKSTKCNKTNKITSSKSLKEKMPDGGTQTIQKNHETSQALLSKYGDSLRVFKLLHPCTDTFNGICNKNTAIPTAM